MLDPFYLQIESREVGASRVVELPRDSIRVGRGRHCDVVLSDASLADVECVLRMRGDTWYVQPLGARSRVSIDSRPVHHLRIVPTGVTMLVGTDRLTIRHSPQTQPDIGTFDTPIPVDPADEPDLSDLQSAPAHDEPEVPVRSRWTRPRSRIAPPTPPEPAVAALADDWAHDTPPTKIERELRLVEINEEEDSSCGSDELADADLSTLETLAAAPECGAAVLSELTDLGSFDASEFTRSVIASDAPMDESCDAESYPSPAAEEPAAVRALPGPSSSRDTQPDKEEVDADGLPDLDDLEWPSARVILAAMRPATPRATPSPRGKVGRSPRPVPTEPVAPRQWSVPASWAVVPVSVVLLAAATAGLGLSVIWGNDAHEAGVIADRLLRAEEGADNGAASAVVSTDAAWWKTTATHLSLKAAALGTSRSGDPGEAEPIPFLLASAQHASPLEPSSRLARVQHGTGDADTLATLGMSRETVNLTVTARRLARDGKPEAALRAYRTALELASRASIDPTEPAVFLKDETPGRFALPNEQMILGVLRDLASQPDWSFAQWNPALPDHPLVLLATYRVLRERESPEADSVLDRLVEAPVSDRASLHDLELAARAEGLALRARHAEAAQLYRDAIAGLNPEPVKRTWWFNLAEILAALGETSTVKDAMESARAGRGDDAIGRLVGQAMARQGFGGPVPDTSQRYRAN